MIIAQLSISPVGKGIHLSSYVKEVVQTLQKEPVTIETNAMCTVIEAETMEILLQAVKKAHESVFKKGANRVITELKIDHRIDKRASLSSKIEAIK